MEACPRLHENPGKECRAWGVGCLCPMIPLLACNVLDTFNVLLLTKVKFTVNFDEMVLIIVEIYTSRNAPPPHIMRRGKLISPSSEAPSAANR